MRALVIAMTPLRTQAEPVPDAAAELLDGLRRSEPIAITRTYQAHHEAVRAFARRLVGDDAAAEDIVHDTFVALPRVIGAYRGESALRTFLIGVALNQARRHIRTAARRRKYEERAGEVRLERDDRADAERRILVQQLFAALDELPLDQRAAFVLCEIEQRSAAEAAAIVGAPEATVRTRLFHARKKLRARLGEESP